MFSIKPKPLALDVFQLGFAGVVRSTNNPEGACVIRSHEGHHHDVFITKGKRGDFKIRLYDTLIGQTILVVSAKTLNEVKNTLNQL